MTRPSPRALLGWRRRIQRTARIKASHNSEAAAARPSDRNDGPAMWWARNPGSTATGFPKRRAAAATTAAQAASRKECSRARERAEGDNHDAAGGARASMTRVLAGGEAIYAVAATPGVTMETQLLFYYSFRLAFFSPAQRPFSPLCLFRTHLSFAPRFGETKHAL